MTSVWLFLIRAYLFLFAINRRIGAASGAGGMADTGGTGGTSFLKSLRGDTDGTYGTGDVITEKQETE